MIQREPSYWKSYHLTYAGLYKPSFGWQRGLLPFYYKSYQLVLSESQWLCRRSPHYWFLLLGQNGPLVGNSTANSGLEPLLFLSFRREQTVKARAQTALLSKAPLPGSHLSSISDADPA